MAVDKGNSAGSASTRTQTAQDRDWATLEQKYYQPTFKPGRLVLHHGNGALVWDVDGREYIDLVGGISTNVLGHAHPAVVQAIQDQVTYLIHVSNIYMNERQVELAEQLYNLSGGMRSFFSNSGAEANEGAIKLARKYGRLHRNGAYEIISMLQSFHGRTLATTAATGQEKYQATWLPLPDGFQQVPFNDLDAVKRATSDKTIGILVEAVQGEGGIRPASVEYMQGLRRWCDEQDLVLICDEVQAGMGRTGRFFSYEHMGIEPDITTMAKGLAGGVPIGAMLANDRLNIFVRGDHGTTFGGNPLACAAGVETVRTIIERNLLQRATDMGGYLSGKLSTLKDKYPELIVEIRGLGLMQAFDLKGERAQEVIDLSVGHGLLITDAGPSTLRIVPPLIITKEQIDEAMARLDAVLGTMTA